MGRAPCEHNSTTSTVALDTVKISKLAAINSLGEKRCSLEWYVVTQNSNTGVRLLDIKSGVDHGLGTWIRSRDLNNQSLERVADAYHHESSSIEKSHGSSMSSLFGCLC